MDPEASLVERLSAAENPREASEWYERDGYYVAACRVSPDDVPGLLELVRRWSQRSWPVDTDGQQTEPMELLPVTAWRALADLKAEEAVQPLVDILREFDDLFEREFDDWTCEELPYVFGKIGPVAIEPLTRLAASAEHGDLIRTIATTGLRRIAQYWPDTRQRIVAGLTQLMQNAAADHHEFNTSVLISLVELQAVEAAEAIERAFAADRIDVGMVGTWEDVRRELGVPGLGLEMPDTPSNSLTGLFRRRRDAPRSAEDLELFMPPEDQPSAAPIVREQRVGRNDPCPCGSGKKFKKCCGQRGKDT